MFATAVDGKLAESNRCVVFVFFLRTVKKKNDTLVVMGKEPPVSLLSDKGPVSYFTNLNKRRHCKVDSSHFFDRTGCFGGLTKYMVAFRLGPRGAQWVYPF